MGYYVSIEDSTFTIPVENLDAAYEKMCQLNFTVPNRQKGGGSYPGKDKAPNLGPNEHSWFSWMDWNYHQTCSDVSKILNNLGFDTDYDDAGNLLIVGYDSKTGQEDLFLKAISPLAKGYIVWKGEQGEVWGETYGGDQVIVKSRIRDYSDIVSV